eukprot:comp17960_c0_seq1/m.18306 comp17960_c0_seq1/g.18306  ORF comp17960_c0_seq1/g.18306 comp17960_c0_seq1/m.18306 type:complete len:124 (-) comp17960_c0_seq1:508-879(-)
MIGGMNKTEEMGSLLVFEFSENDQILGLPSTLVLACGMGLLVLTAIGAYCLHRRRYTWAVKTIQPIPQQKYTQIPPLGRQLSKQGQNLDLISYQSEPSPRTSAKHGRNAEEIYKYITSANTQL